MMESLAWFTHSIMGQGSSLAGSREDSGNRRIKWWETTSGGSTGVLAPWRYVNIANLIAVPLTSVTHMSF